MAEQLVAAVTLLILVALVHAWLMPARFGAWTIVLFVLLGAGLGAWLAAAVNALERQRRIAAKYAKLRGGGAPITAEDFKQALINRGWAARPVEQEEQK